MPSPAALSPAASPRRHLGEALRAAFIGAETWLEGCAPPHPTGRLEPRGFALAPRADRRALFEEIARFRPHVSVVFDPAALAAEELGAIPGLSLGVLVDGLPENGEAARYEQLDRIISFRPALTGCAIGEANVWRAIPPPVSDAHFGEVRALANPPRAMSIGRSSERREEMLMPAKHHHDLLQVIHGVSGERLRELLGECDVGVFVGAEPGPAFGLQVGLHLAAGQLLLAGDLAPAHGLERNIDYLHVDSPDGLVWLLDRLRRFPSMYQRVRMRGRIKAEQYRASRLFERVLHDLFWDVAAFDASRA